MVKILKETVYTYEEGLFKKTSKYYKALLLEDNKGRLRRDSMPITKEEFNRLNKTEV